MADMGGQFDEAKPRAVQPRVPSKSPWFWPGALRS